jgi:hypothetical protein
VITSQVDERDVVPGESEVTAKRRTHGTGTEYREAH